MAFLQRHPLQITNAHASICVEADRTQLRFPDYLTQLYSFQMSERKDLAMLHKVVSGLGVSFSTVPSALNLFC